MKSNFFRGTLVLILSAALMISSVPMTAYAADGGGEIPVPSAENGGNVALNTPAGSEMVLNPGFEQGTAGQLPAKWNILDGSDAANGTAIINENAAYVNYGTRSLQLSYKGTGTYGVISDPMTVTEGEALRLSVHYRGASGTGSFQAYLNFYDGTGKLIQASPKYGATNTSGWNYVMSANAAIVPAGATTARCVLSLGTADTSTDVGFYLDRAMVVSLDPSVTAVRNSGFEDGIDANTGLPAGYDVWEWTDGTKGTVELSTARSYKGQHSAKLTTKGSVGQNSIRSNLVAVTPGVSYNFNAYTYNESGGNPVIRARFYTKDGRDLGIKDASPAASGAWVKTTSTMTAPVDAAFATVMVYQNCHSQNNVTTVTYVDEMSVIKTSDDTPELPVSAVLQNPGFEGQVQQNGMPANWTKWPSNAAGKYAVGTAIVHSGDGYNGTHSMEVVDDSDSTAGIESDPVQVTAGTKYRASAWIYNKSGAGISLYLNYYKNKEDAIAGTNRLTPVPNTYCKDLGKWEQIATDSTVAAPDGATCATIGFYSGTTPQTDSFLDNVDLSPVPDKTYPTKVQNACFEGSADANGVPANWSKLTDQDRASVSTDQHFDGTHSAKLVNDSTQGCGLRSDGVAVTPGVTYQAAAKIYCDIGCGEIYLEFWNAAGSRIGVQTALVSRTKQWCDVSAIGVAPAGAAYATLLFYQSSGEQGIMYGDCASIAPYTPPVEQQCHFNSIIQKHPKVCFTANDVASLRKLAQSTEKTANGATGKEVADQIMSEAGSYLNETSYTTHFGNVYGTSFDITIQNPPVQQPVSPDAPAGYGTYPFWTSLSRSLEDRMEILSMAYMFTGNQAYARKVIDFVTAMSNWNLWHDPKDNYPEALTNLDTAHLVQGAAMAYDVCYDQMTDAERLKIRNAIIKLGLEPLYQDGKEKIDFNIQGLRNAALATGSLAIMGDVDSSVTDRYLTNAVDYFKWYLNEKETSGNEEGFGYTSYALENIVDSFDQLARVTGDTSLIKNRYLNDTLMKWIVSFSAPGSYDLAPISDFVEGTEEFYQICSTLAKNGNGLAGWYLTHAKLGGSDISQTQKFLYLCSASSITSSDPRTAVNKSSYVPEVGWGVLRTGWNPTDSMLGLISNNSSMGHNHFDQNSFLIAANGTWLGDDPGYSTFDSTQQALLQFNGKVGHNTILVDWRKNTASGSQVFKGGGSLTPNILTSSYGYLIGSAAQSYGLNVLKQYDRHAIMINHAGRPYYVLFDALDSAQPRTYTWSLFTKGWDAFSVDGNAVNGVTSSQNGNLLKVNRNATTLYTQFIGNDKHQIDSDLFTINSQSEGPYIHVSNPQKAQQYNFMAVMNTYADETNIPASVFQPTNVMSKGSTGTLTGTPPIALFRGEAGAGSSVSYKFDVPETGDYTVNLLHPTSPAYGIYQMSVDGVKSGSLLDGYSSSVSMNNPEFTVGTTHLTAGTHTLTATCVGTNAPKKDKFLIGITNIHLKKAKADTSADAPIKIAQTIDTANTLGAKLAYTANANDIVLFSRNKTPINSLGVSTDARQVSMIGLKSDGTLDGIGVNSSTSLNYGGKALFTSTTPVSAYVDYLNGVITIQASKDAKITFLNKGGRGTVCTLSANAGTTVANISSGTSTGGGVWPAQPIVPNPFTPAPRQDTGLGTTFLSDTTAPLSVNDAYTFKITSKNGKAPKLVVGTDGVFSVDLTKKDGNDYYFKLTATGKPGSSAGIYINGGARLLVATVKENAYYRSDTTADFTVNDAYTFKITSKDGKAPKFVVGTDGVFSVNLTKKNGNDYYFKLTATGKPGSKAGIYIDRCSKLLVATVKENAFYHSDTTADFRVKESYTFKITSKDGKVPKFVVGTDGVFSVDLTKKNGNDYYFKITAIGKSGSKAGIYIDSCSRLLVATVN